MNTLVLRPGSQLLEYACFRGGASRPSFEGRVADCRGADRSREAIARIAAEMPAPDAIAVRAIYGGDRFTQATIVTEDVVRELEALVPRAPLHASGLLPLLQACQEQFPSAPLVLVFETAFFTALPPREYLYAVDTELPGFHGVRRYGFHGILHEAACRETLRRHRAEGLTEGPRVLSVCLEPRPELAAVIGLTPVMVTSGATPLEGLPGQTSSGELDPSIVIALATEHGWGAEQINTALTQESGLKGLAGRAVTFEQVYVDEGPEARLAREVFQYRLLLSCGAGVAAMGGLDALVFSGRLVSLGQRVYGWLRAQPLLQSLVPLQPPAVRYYRRTLSRVMADEASAVLMAAELHGRAQPSGRTEVRPHVLQSPLTGTTGPEQSGECGACSSCCP